jgi:hypothetical protein
MKREKLRRTLRLLSFCKSQKNISELIPHIGGSETKFVGLKGKANTQIKFSFAEFRPPSAEKILAFSLHSLVEICVFAHLALTLVLASQVQKLGGGSEILK